MIISKREAEFIAQKLDAEIKNGRRHQIVTVRYNGRHVASYGIQRGSGEKSHSYIPAQLHVSKQQATALAQCSLDKDTYFSILRNKGVIPPI